MTFPELNEDVALALRQRQSGTAHVGGVSFVVDAIRVWPLVDQWLSVAAVVHVDDAPGAWWIASRVDGSPGSDAVIDELVTVIHGGEDGEDDDVRDALHELLRAVAVAGRV